MGEQLAFYNLLGISFIGAMIWIVAVMKYSLKWLVISVFLMLVGAMGTAFVLLYYFNVIYNFFWLCSIVWTVMIVSILYGVIKIFLSKKQCNQAN